MAIQLASMDSRFFLKLLVHGTGLGTFILEHVGEIMAAIRAGLWELEDLGEALGEVNLVAPK